MEDTDLENRLQQSSLGGKHAALQDVVTFLRNQSGEYFASGKDEEAKIIRRIAVDIEKLRVKASFDLSDAMNRVAP